MAKLVFLPIEDQIQSNTYVLYDGALGTGGMLTVAEQTIRDIAESKSLDVIHTPVRPRDKLRNLRHLQSGPAAERRRERRRQHYRGARTLDAVQRCLQGPHLRLHAEQSPLWKGLEG